MSDRKLTDNVVDNDQKRCAKKGPRMAGGKKTCREKGPRIAVAAAQKIMRRVEGTCASYKEEKTSQ